MDREGRSECGVSTEKSYTTSAVPQVCTDHSRHQGGTDSLQTGLYGNEGTLVLLGDARTNLESLLEIVGEYWKKSKDTNIPKDLKFSSGYDRCTILTACMINVSGSVVILSLLVVLLNPEAFGISRNNIDIFYQAFQGTNRHLAVLLTVGSFVIAGLLCIGCITIQAIRKNKEQKKRDELLSKLYESAKIYHSYRPLIDSESLSVNSQILKTCGSLAMRVNNLEINDLERTILLDAIKRMRTEYRDGIMSIKKQASEDLLRINTDIRTIADSVQNWISCSECSVRDKIKELAEEIKIRETNLIRSAEEINRCSELNTDTIRSILQRGLESTTKKAEDIKCYVTALNADILSVVTYSIQETGNALERVIEVRRECMKILSCMFVEKNSAVVAASVILLDAHSHIKEVSVLSAGHSYDEIKRKLEYRVPKRVAGFFRDTLTVHETIASVYPILSEELEPILKSADALRSITTEGKSFVQYGETCLRIIKRCDERLFHESGILNSRILPEFLKKLSYVVQDEHCTADNGLDMLIHIKKCTPFFLVMPHVIKIALGIEGMNIAADEIYSVAKKVEGTLTGVFPFFPRDHALTSQLNVPDAQNFAACQNNSLYQVKK